jgi:hypothetical protein
MSCGCVKRPFCKGWLLQIRNYLRDQAGSPSLVFDLRLP